MALSFTNRGIWTHNTLALTATCSPASNFVAGSTAAIAIAADNNAAGGTPNNITNVTDSLGNTWSVAPNSAVVFDPGAAAAGVQGSIWVTEMNAGVILTSTVITITFGTTTQAKSGTLTQVTPAAGKIARCSSGGAKAAGATATAATSGATGTINIGQGLLVAIYIEAGTTQTCTGDSDTTNGTWSALQYAEIGSTTSGSCCASQAKVQTTANSTQTYDCTLGISSDYHASWAIFSEVDAAINVTPTAALATMVAAGPTVTFGALDKTPTAALATMVAANPTVTFGALNVTPTAAVLTLVGADPTAEITGGNQDVTPTAAFVTLSAAAPAVSFGALSKTPTPAITTMSAAAPTVSFGALSVTPTPAVLTMNGAAPAVTFGALSKTPTAALLSMQGAAPVVSFGALSKTPAPAVLSLVGATPAITFGALSKTPTPAVLTLVGADPSVQITGGPQDVTPTPALLSFAAAAPTISFGALTVTPTPAWLTLLGATPIISDGNETAIVYGDSGVDLNASRTAAGVTSSRTGAVVGSRNSGVVGP